MSKGWPEKVSSVAGTSFSFGAQLLVAARDNARAIEPLLASPETAEVLKAAVAASIAAAKAWAVVAERLLNDVNEAEASTSVSG